MLYAVYRYYYYYYDCDYYYYYTAVPSSTESRWHCFEYNN